MTTKAQIVARAREYIDTPFSHQGRTPHVALDCVGLCASVGKAEGLEVVDYTNYRRRPDWTRFRQQFDMNCQFLGNNWDVAEPGVMVVLREGRYQTHCAIVAEKDGHMTIIHAYEPRGKTVEERVTPEWGARLCAVYLPNGVT